MSFALNEDTAYYIYNTFIPPSCCLCTVQNSFLRNLNKRYKNTYWKLGYITEL